MSTKFRPRTVHEIPIPSHWLLVICIFAVCGDGVRADDDQTDETYFEPYLALIEEVDVRRRVNVLYPNPQSIFDGLQVGFVNVGTGNLTFLRRDIVVDSEEPLVFGRVYDSRIVRNPDFGKGWRLSLVEELRFDDTGVVYVDASGTRYRFKDTDAGYVQSPATPSHAGTLIVRDGNRARLTDGTGVIRYFDLQPSRSTFLIESLKTNSGHETRFRYRGDGLLHKIRRAGSDVLVITRNGSGRVWSVTDEHDRRVRYSYTDNGQLKDVRIRPRCWATREVS